MHCDCFEDLIFMDDKLPMKTAKITSLKNYSKIIRYLVICKYIW